MQQGGVGYGGAVVYNMSPKGGLYIQPPPRRGTDGNTTEKLEGPSEAIDGAEVQKCIDTRARAWYNDSG